ncbi:MAG: hypothetical protein HC828_21760 [Blastochloris sp.]|nr:hypothetical protein [Blastochloris sp.]
MRWFYNLVVFGCAFAMGWLIFNPPGWWPGGSIMNALLWACLGGLGLLVFFGILIASNLPANLRIDELPASIALPAELNRLRTEYLKLGFEQVGAPMRIHIAPPAMVIGVAKPDLGIYGTIFVTGHETPKVSYDLVSMIRLPQSFSSDQGILTTGPDPGGASLPASTGSFIQIFHEAPPKSLYKQHLLALEWLLHQMAG